mgnify:CR=1 FL=1|jgi:hypothetical protein
MSKVNVRDLRVPKIQNGFKTKKFLLKIRVIRVELNPPLLTHTKTLLSQTKTNLIVCDRLH